MQHPGMRHQPPTSPPASKRARTAADMSSTCPAAGQRLPSSAAQAMPVAGTAGSAHGPHASAAAGQHAFAYCQNPTTLRQGGAAGHSTGAAGHSMGAAGHSMSANGHSRVVYQQKRDEAHTGLPMPASLQLAQQHLLAVTPHACQQPRGAALPVPLGPGQAGGAAPAAGIAVSGQAGEDQAQQTALRHEALLRQFGPVSPWLRTVSMHCEAWAACDGGQHLHSMLNAQQSVPC